MESPEKKSRFRRPSAAMVVATLALGVAIGGGGAYAAVQINGNNIKNSTITTNKLKDKAVTGAKMANGSVGKTQLSDSAVTTYLRYITVTVPMGHTKSAMAVCNYGDDVVGGGYGGVPANVYQGYNATVLFNRPATIDGQAPTNGKIPVGWNASLENGTTTSAEFLVYVTCLND